MNLRRLLARSISECWALRSAVIGSQNGLRILLYHAVGSRLRRDPYGISIDIDLFERHMALLAKRAGIRLTSLADWVPGCEGLHVAVTFDDGYRDNLYRAAPILQRHGIPFTVFVTTSYLRSGSDEFLTPKELRELSAIPGAAVGSHGSTHVPLAACDNLSLESELNESRHYLENLLGQPVTTIAYPHGSVSRHVTQKARQAGYNLGCCSRFGLNDESQDRLLLHRTEVLAVDSERVFMQKLYGAWDWCRWRNLLELGR